MLSAVHSIGTSFMYLYLYIVCRAVKIVQDEQKNDTTHLVYYAGLTIKYIGRQYIF